MRVHGAFFKIVTAPCGRERGSWSWNTLSRAGDDPDIAKFFDLQMLVLTAGGRERTETEFRELYGEAGFDLTRVVATKNPVHVIEGVRR